MKKIQQLLKKIMMDTFKIPLVAAVFATQATLALTPLSMTGPTPALPNSMNVGSSQTFSYNITNNAPKTAPLTVSAFTDPAVVRTSVDCTNNCGSTLPAGLSCNICVQITPTSQDFTAGKISQSLVVDYTGRAPLEAVILINTITSSSPLASLAGPVPPITNMIVGDSLTVGYTVTNTGTLPTDPISISGLSNPVSLQSDTCSGHTLAPSGNCTFDVNISPTQTGPIDQTLSVTYGGASPLTSPIQLTVLSPTGVSVGGPFPILNQKSRATGGLIFQTVDGSWTSVAPEGEGPLSSVTNNGTGGFVGVGPSNEIIFSQDGGVTWTSSTITPIPPITLNFTSVAFNSNNHTFVAVGQPSAGTGLPSIYYSTDEGATWAPSNPLGPPPPRATQPTAASAPPLVLYDPIHLLFDAFISGSSGCDFYHSIDGITWTLGNSVSNTIIHAVTTDTTKVLAIGHTQNTPIAGEECTSSDGLVFSCSEPVGVPNDWSGISFAVIETGTPPVSVPTYVTTTSAGHIWTSTTDGISGWTEQVALFPPGPTSLLNAVTYGPFLGNFYAVGAFNGDAAMYLSDDGGASWTAVVLLPPPGVFAGMLNAVSIE